MDLKRREACPICGSEDMKKHINGTVDADKIDNRDFKITDSNYGSRWIFFRCAQCGFVFSNPYVPKEKIIEFYSLLEDREYSSEADGRLKNFKTILKRLAKLDKPGNKILDVGAASGIFLNQAKMDGYNVYGIEPSAFLVQEAKELYGLQLQQGTIEDYREQDKFSIITLLDIIEHLVEPDEFMDQVDALIEPGGILIIVTPDIDSLPARIVGKRWWHYRTAHVNFFNKKSLVHLLSKHNYQIILKKRYAWNFSLLYLVSRIFPSILNKKALQKTLKSINFKLQLFDSWEIYARKK